MILLFLWSIIVVASAQETTYKAIVYLRSGNISGNVTFAETDEGIHVQGWVTGLSVGSYGFHIHELGDIGTCDSAGAHFDPDGVTHGGRDHEIRHVGDLGNIQFEEDEDPTAVIDFVDDVIALRGRNSILGRTLVLHEREDDLGLGDHEDSLTTGNAGARVACGIIGILSPKEPWNGAVNLSATRASLVFVLTNLFANLN